MSVAIQEVDLPTTWKWARCQDMIDVRDGTHDTPKKLNSGIPLITSKNLKPNGIDFKDVTFISKEDHKEIEKRSGVDDGDVLFAMIGTIGNPVLVRKDRPFSIKNVALFKLGGTEVYPPFFKTLLESPVITRQLSLVSRGGNQKFVSLTVLRDMKIPLPPLSEQKRIAGILDKADAVRRKRQQAIGLTEQFLRSTFLDMFGDPVTNPKGWPVASLGKLADVRSGVTKGKKFNGNPTVHVPYMRVANVQDGHLVLDEIKKIEVLTTDADSFLLQDGDVLLTEGGDFDKLGRGTVWRNEIERCIHQNHIFRVRPKSSAVKSDFLSAQIGSGRGKRYFLRAAKQTTGIATINKTQLNDFPVLVPPSDLQEKYSTLVRRHDSSLAHITNKYEIVDALFNALVQLAFRGEL